MTSKRSRMFLYYVSGILKTNTIMLVEIVMYNPISPNLLPVLKEWSRDLDKNDIDWCRVLNNIFTGITNNYKLIQFQYKLLMRISTCKYMRYKLHITRDSDQCSLCNSALETWHIYLSIVLIQKFSRID